MSRRSSAKPVGSRDAWLIWAAAAAGAGSLLFLLPPASLNVWWKGALAAAIGALVALACLSQWLVGGTRKGDRS